MTFEEALAGAGDPELHPTIRSKYVDLLIGNAFSNPHCSGLTSSGQIQCICPVKSLTFIAVLFVDVGDNHSVLETLANSFVRSCILSRLLS